MNDLSNWLEPQELNSLSENIKIKLNLRIQETVQNLIKAQNDYSNSSLAYENTISLLNKNLQEQNQKYYELEMDALKLKTLPNRKEMIEDHGLKSKFQISKSVNILKTKISSLIAMNKELQLKNESLNTQIEFIIQNKDQDSQEICLLTAAYAAEVNELKEKLNNTDQSSIKNLKNELEVLRKNETEYQSHIYTNTKQLYDFHNRINQLETENSLLSQYKFKYENLYHDYLRISALANELKLKNYEFRNFLQLQDNKSEILKEIEQIKNFQIEAFKSIQRSRASNEVVFEIDPYILPIKQEINGLVLYVNGLINLKDQLRHIFSLFIEEIDQKSRQLEDQEALIKSYNNSKEQKLNFSDSEAELLKQENEILKAKISLSKPDSDILYENESLMSENSTLKGEIDFLKNELAKISGSNIDFIDVNEKLKMADQTTRNALEKAQALNSDLKKSNKGFKKEILENKQMIEDLTIKISNLENEIIKMDEEKYNEFDRREKLNMEDEDYIRNLENELDLYKKDVKSIENQFTEYKKLYESFNIDATNEKIALLKTNVERKSILIESLYSLLGRYRKISDMFISRS